MIIFAHRGASGYVPQNSIVSIKKAVELGAKAIEFDVQLSKDGVPVIIHDFFLEKLTVEGKGYVKNHSLEELKRLKLTSKGGYSNETIPTLEEFLTALPDDMFINVELKSIVGSNVGLEEEVVKVLKKFPNKKDLLISSFDHQLLQRFQEKYPEYPIGALISTNLIDMESYIENNPLKLTSINLAIELVDEKLIEKIHGAGLKLFVYTVNDIDTAEKFSKIGVNGIFSDYPDLLSKC